jgi:hypothetical protein
MQRVGLVTATVLVAALGWWLGSGGGRATPRQLQITAVCEAIDAERYDEAIAASESLVSADPDGRIAAECRCWALLNRDRRDDCAELIDAVLVEAPDDEWVPHPVLATLVARTRMQQGRGPEAANLARAATTLYPTNLKLLELEIQARSAVEGHDAAHAAVEARIPDEPAPYPLRIALAASHLAQFDADAAQRVLGEVPPPRGDRLTLIWFENRARAIATGGDIVALKRHFDVWAQTGADPADLRGRYALRVSVSHLRDPNKATIDLLKEALVDQASLADGHLRWALYRRLIGTLVADARIDDALALYDEGVQYVAFPNLTREEIERAETPVLAAASGGTAKQGTLVFRLSLAAQDSKHTKRVLQISPDPSQPPDQDYERYPLDGAETVRVRRSRAHTPQRWVLSGDAGEPLASGMVWPQAGAEIDVEIQVDPNQSLPQAHVDLVGPTQEADGRRRLVALILDCADWRLIQYLRARNELPQLDQLLETGYSAVLESTPAFTAAAMESLVWPMRGRDVSFLGLVQKMGLELGGLASVGANPLDFLSVVLPESESLFEVIGAGEHVAANMLFSHGGIDAGHHAETLGPLSERRDLELPQSFRPLRKDEIARYPGMDLGPRQRRRMETIAAEFDSTEKIIRDGEVDLLVLRIEPLDLLTHAFFRDLLSGGQDDGNSALLAAYRYIDERLAAVYSAIDRDDVLLIMSDHGIRTPMEHETDALFVLAGADVPQGRAQGQPHLRGVPKILASLLGVATPWPDSGIASWLEEPSEAKAEVALGN